MLNLDGRSSPSFAKETLPEVSQGNDSLGNRLESFTKNLPEDLLAPDMIVGMSLGGVGFRAGRLFALGPLSRGRQGFLARRFLAPLSGLSTETAVFTFSTKGIRSVLGSPEEWHPLPIFREISGTAVMFASLRIFGSAGRRLHARVHGESNRTAFFRVTGTLYTQTAMLGGITMGLGLEQNAFPGRNLTARNLTEQSLLTWFHFNAGGAIARRVLGWRMATLERQMDQKISTWERVPENPWKPSNSLAPVLNIPWTRSRSEAPNWTLAMMTGKGPKGPRSRPRAPTLPFTEVTIDSKDPLTITHPMQIARRMKETSLKFGEKLKQGNLVFRLAESFNINPNLPNIILTLNGLAKSHKIPQGAQVTFLFPTESDQTSITLRLGPHGFESADPETGPKKSPGKRKKRRITALFEKSLIDQLEVYKTENYSQFLRRLNQEGQRELWEGILINHPLDKSVNLNFGSGVDFSPQGFLKLLNGLNGLQRIPSGRKICVQTGEEGQIVEFLKKGRFFKNLSNPEKDSYSQGSSSPFKYLERSDENSHLIIEAKTRSDVIQGLKDPTFLETLENEDVYFQVTGETIRPGVSLNMEGTFRAMLNLLAPKIEIKDSSESPRRIRLSIMNTETGKPLDLTVWQWNREAGVFDLISERAEPFSPMNTLPDPDSRIKSTGMELTPSRDLPVLTSMDHIERLPLLLERIDRQRPPGENPPEVILENFLTRNAARQPVDIDTVYLNKLTAHLGKKLKNDGLFTLLVPAKRQTFQGHVKGQQFQWLQSKDLFWQQTALRVLVNETSVSSSAELYQLLVALGSDAQRAPETRAVIHFDAPLPRRGAMSFENFIVRNLNHLKVRGSSFEIRFPSGAEPVVLFNHEGRWKLEARISL